MILDFLIKPITDLISPVVKSFLPPEKMSEEASKTLDAEIQKAVMQMDFSVLEAEIQDRASARSREVELAKSGNKDMTPKILAYGVSVGFFGVLGIMIFVPLNGSTETIINIMVGSLGTAWTGIIAYYFGSSAGSRSKDDTIKKLSQ